MSRCARVLLCYHAYVHCPNCSSTLKTIRKTGHEVEYCIKCKGLWLSADEFSQMTHALSKHPSTPHLKIDLDKNIIPRILHVEHEISCPTCHRGMHLINFAYDSNVFINKCGQCGGIWVDHGEIERIAIHLKSNPLLKDIATSLYDHEDEKQELRRLTYYPVMLTDMPIPIKDKLRTTTTPWVTRSILYLNFIVFVIGLIYSGADEYAFLQAYGLIPSAFRLDMIITSMFLHAGPGHLIANLLYLAIFGDNVEEKFGHTIFAILYVLFNLSSTLAILLFYPGSTHVFVGASGAISGILGAYLVFFKDARILTIWATMIYPMRATTYIIFWFLMQLVAAVILRNPAVAYIGHVAGFITGLAAAYAWKRLDRPRVSTQIDTVE